MTVNQTSINDNVRYNSFPVQSNGNNLNWWRRLRLATQFLLNSRAADTDPDSYDEGYVHHKIHQKEISPIDVFASEMKFDLSPCP